MSAAGIKTSKKPVDPLSNSEYIYSLTSETREYALKADYEGDSVAVTEDQDDSVFASAGEAIQVK